METKQMTNEQMQQFVAENIDLVPANQRKRFELYPIEKKVDKIMFYRSTKQMWAEAAEKNKLVNKVTELMAKRNATIQDAKLIKISITGIHFLIYFLRKRLNNVI